MRGCAALVAVLLGVLAGSAPAECSCDCCAVVLSDLGTRCTRAPAVDGGKRRYPDQQACSDTCSVNVTHSSLTPKLHRGSFDKQVRDTAEVDIENFCYHDCRQKSSDDDRQCEAGIPIPTAVPAVAPAPVKPRALLRTRVVQKASREGGESDDGAGSRTEDLARGAADRLALATASATVAQDVDGGAMRSEAFVKKAVDMAQQKGTRAAVYMRAALKANDLVQEGAQKFASEVVESTLKDVISQAHDVAKAEANKKAEKLEADMKKAAPAAGQAAIKPYTEAMNKAAADAAAWAKQGDAAAGQAFQLSLAAGMTMAQANQWNALGDFPRAQGMLRQSMETTQMALGIAGAAQKAYDTAADITGHLMDYVPMMGAAQYHAEYMLNPDMPPPAAFR